MGMQFMGRIGHDRKVLEFAMAYEATTDYLDQRPALTESIWFSVRRAQQEAALADSVVRWNETPELFEPVEDNVDFSRRVRVRTNHDEPIAVRRDVVVWKDVGFERSFEQLTRLSRTKLRRRLQGNSHDPVACR